MTDTVNALSRWLKQHPVASEILLLILALIAATSFIFYGSHPDVVQDAWQYLLVAKKLTLAQPLSSFESFHLVKTPPYIAFLRIIFIFTGVASDQAMIHGVRVAQIALYVFNIGLISRCTSMLTGSKITGLLAGVLGILYLPMLFFTDRVLTETLMITFLLVFTWLWLKDKKWVAAVALFLALATSLLTLWIKLFFAFVALGAYYGLGWLFEKDSELRKNLNQSCLQLVKVLLMVTALYLVTKPIVFGWANGGNPGQAFVRFADTQGWAPTVGFNGFYQELYLFSSPVFKALRPFLSEEVSLLLSWAFYEPWECFSRYVVNIVRFFSRPDNPFLQSWLGISPDWLLQLHLLIRAVCLMGLPVIFIKGRLNVLLVLSVVWASCYSAHHIEARYNLPMMPLLIITAVTIVHWIIKDCPARKKIFIGWFAGLLCLNVLVRPSLTDVFPGLSVPFSLLPMSLAPVGIHWLSLFGFILLTGMVIQSIVQLSFWPRYLQFKISNSNLSRGLTYGVVGFFIVYFFTDPVIYSFYEMLPSGKTATQLITVDKHKRDAFLESLNATGTERFENYLLVEARRPNLKPSADTLVVSVNGLIIEELANVSSNLNAFEGLTAGLNQPSDFVQYRYFKIDDVQLRQMLTEDRLSVVLENTSQTPVVLPYDYPQVNLFYSGAYVIPSFDWGRESRFKALYDRESRLSKVISTSFVKGEKNAKYRFILLRFLHDADNTLTPRPTFSIKNNQIEKMIYFLY